MGPSKLAVEPEAFYMAKKLTHLFLIAVIAVAFTGCARGGDGLFYRTWKHVEWHVLGAYKDLTDLHREFDRYIFDLDERDPDRY